MHPTDLVLLCLVNLTQLLYKKEEMLALNEMMNEISFLK